MSVDTLELRGLFYLGQAFDFTWQWPTQATHVHFAELLRACPAPGVAHMPYLDACTLHARAAPSGTQWSVSPESGDIACSVNGQALEEGSMAQLHDGDTLEVGLLSFQVHLLAPSAQAHAADLAMQRFVLTDLDEVAPDEGYDTRLRGISDLINTELVTDPAANGPAAAPPSATTEQGDVLSVLHTQYLRKLRDPAYNSDEGHWQGLVQARESAATLDPFDDLKLRAGNENSLSDLVGQAQTIGEVFADLDEAMAHEFMKPDRADSVLHLFAPKELQAQAPAESAATALPGSLAHLLQASLPGLTLREHHSLSLDSAMPLFSDTPDTATKAPTLNTAAPHQALPSP
ncbi:TagK domain-containing protein [Rhodoferax aquaticus]|uniref:TagK domain-containing protein n=1 Tax=Rhodoferax aquaticus TaxID=2527691 RepID=A0A515EPY4_9BURK|nr:TagK domain-containing protein [Rhodoferax aquaticus]QDL54680.1 TagK domain-containing protein [Rhodoferax aquaticus]